MKSKFISGVIAGAIALSSNVVSAQMTDSIPNSTNSSTYSSESLNSRRFDSTPGNGTMQRNARFDSTPGSKIYDTTSLGWNGRDTVSFKSRDTIVRRSSDTTVMSYERSNRNDSFNKGSNSNNSVVWNNNSDRSDSSLSTNAGGKMRRDSVHHKGMNHTKTDTYSSTHMDNGFDAFKSEHNSLLDVYESRIATLKEKRYKTKTSQSAYTRRINALTIKTNSLRKKLDNYKWTTETDGSRFQKEYHRQYMQLGKSIDAASSGTQVRVYKGKRTNHRNYSAKRQAKNS